LRKKRIIAMRTTEDKIILAEKACKKKYSAKIFFTPCTPLESLLEAVKMATRNAATDDVPCLDQPARASISFEMTCAPARMIARHPVKCLRKMTILGKQNLNQKPSLICSGVFMRKKPRREKPNITTSQERTLTSATAK